MNFFLCSSFARRSRPWLLLWLVPYLLLSVASEGLHNHALELKGDLPQPPALSASTSRVATNASCAWCPSNGSHNHNLQTECLACQWSAQSVGFLSLATLKPLPRTAVEVASCLVVSPRCSARDISRSRGPPLF